MLRALLDNKKFDRLLARLEKEHTASASGLYGASFGLLTAAVASRWSGPIVIVAAGPEESDAIEDDLSVFSRRQVLAFPAWDVLPTETDTPETEVISARVSAVRRLADFQANEQTPRDAADWEAMQGEEDLPDAQARLLIPCSIQSLIQGVPSADALGRGEWVLRQGEEVPLLRLQHWLLDHGFERVATVESRGEFSIRGGIVDIYPLMGDERPHRLEFFGEELESVRWFDPYTQRSTKRVRNLRLVGLDKRGLTDPFTLGDPVNLLDYLPDDALIVTVEPHAVRERADSYLSGAGAESRLFDWEQLTGRISRFAHLRLESQRETEQDTDDTEAFDVTSVQRFEGRLETVMEEIGRARSEAAVSIYCLNDAERKRLETILHEHGVVPDGNLQLLIGHVSAGCDFRDIDQICLTDHELFRRYAQRRRVKKHAAPQATPVEHFLDLETGDFVVHSAHGIARYLGLSTLEREGRADDYLTLLFANEVKVYVPATHVHLVGKYVGMGEAQPQLSKVGGKAWVRKKQRAQRAIRDIASELLEVQARRRALPGFAYPSDDEWQLEFEASFIYEETDDQLTATSAIKDDLERPTPMDRLLCGDVGFGKTEVAVRAAFKAVTAGRQVAVLVPTTVLAEQHGKTFTERMAGYPVRTEVLSRFRTKKEQNKVLRELEHGQVDVIVGTHRLLSKDVKIPRLGLAIVDEEQRFGVEHKEALKKHRSNVDVLTLTATPIPRTMHMAMLGLRDISALTIPPEDRLAIRTKVCRYSPELVRRAILRELARDGQVYFVHNRVQDIKLVADELRELVPEARFVVGHGQMAERELARVMRAFIHHQADVLVSTTIIESGVDIPNANTMFINNANWFGLADLHQLRGRVGRYKHRAYAYLMIPPEGAISEPSRKRLKAIEEFDDLGAGFRLAMRDMEIRGAGNLLGAEQSGHIAEVGYDLYCKLLDKTVRELRGETVEEPIDVMMQLGFPSFIPPDYMPDERQRLDLYRRLWEVVDEAALAELTDELADRFGRPPIEVRRLLAEAPLRAMAARARIPFVGVEQERLKLKLHGWSFAQLEARLKNAQDVRVLSAEEITFPLPVRLRRAVAGNATATGAASGATADGSDDPAHQQMVAHVKKLLESLLVEG